MRGVLHVLAATAVFSAHNFELRPGEVAILNKFCYTYDPDCSQSCKGHEPGPHRAGIGLDRTLGQSVNLIETDGDHQY